MVSLRSLLGSIILFSAAVHAKSKKVEEPEQEKEIDKVIQLRTHTIFAPYIDQDLQNRWWDFGADSYINTNKHIRLTRNVPSQLGWLWSRLPLTAAHWVIETEIKISGNSGHLYGDGMAMWLTTDRAKPGPVFGSIDKFNGLGIFIDTYANGRHNYSFPRILAMLGDGLTSYDQGEDGEPNALAGCSASLRRTNVATKLKLTYIHDDSLDLKIQYKAWDEWTPCFHIQKVKIPANLYLGFSAMTGDVSDAHDVISVSTSSLLLSAQTGNTRSKFTSSPRVTERAAALFSFRGLLKLIFFGAIIALVGVAARTYARQRGGLQVAGFELLNRAGGLSLQKKTGKTF